MEYPECQNLIAANIGEPWRLLKVSVKYLNMIFVIKTRGSSNLWD